MMAGIVYIVGAGPGDPELLTLRGRRVLEEADAVVFDALIDRSILRWARPDAELHYVGKRSGSHSASQEEIDELLVRLGSEGKRVVRLKGGDPFVFGRGGEEGVALKAAGIPFEFVPGVTSPIAALEYAGIPITHRVIAGSAAIVTGHRFRDGTEHEHDWNALAKVDTLVVVMGVGNMPRIVRRLLDAGKPPDTPAAMVHWGTTPRQQVVVGTLADIAERGRAAGVTPPAITVFGRVVRLRDRLRWFDLPERRPLLGKRVLVTRASGQAWSLADLLAERGADPVVHPTIRIVPQNVDVLDEAIGRLGRYTWLLFTSANGVRIFWKRLEAAGKDARALGKAKVGAIGPGTAAALAERGVRADFVPSDFVAEAILEEIGDVAGERFLLPRAEGARKLLVDRLREMGAEVDEVKIYRAEPVLDPPPLDVDWVTFTSPSTVKGFVESLEANGLSPAPGAKVACIGPITAQAARDLGLPVDAVAEVHTIEGLVEAVTMSDCTPIRMKIGRR